VLLDLAGRTELVERALGHPRKDVDHWVDPILLGVNVTNQESIPRLRVTTLALYKITMLQIVA
jgi:hypothetical protein